MGLRVLITGICGFAGSVLAKSLVEHLPGVRVTGFDNLSRAGSELNREPLTRLGMDVRIGDIRDQEFLAGLPAADWVIDCAANPSVLAGTAGGSQEVVDQNLGGTTHMLEWCKRWGAGFILLSTSRVYSIPALQKIPLVGGETRFEPDTGMSGVGWSGNGITEDFSTAPPLSLYGSTKLCSELLALEYGSAFGFPVWINRCGVLAGPGQFGKADQGIFSYWIHSWKAGRPLRYIGFGGSGKQVRDCLHPRDIVPLLIRQIHSPGARCPRVLNVSGGLQSSMSLAELSLWCRERFGPSPSEADLGIPTAEDRPYDLAWVVLDAAAATESWNWQPSTPRDLILEEIARHAEANPHWVDICQSRT